MFNFFLIFKMAAIFRSQQTFLPDVLPEFEYTIKIAMSTFDILSFWSTFYLKYWRRNTNFKNRPTLSPGDAITDIMNTRLTEYSHNLIKPMGRKFNDDIFARF